jgi:DNA-binding LacI/PurR family transcriptional regulator
MPGHAEPTIYEVARVAGVAPSTVSRASSKPGRVSYKTAEHVRRVAEQLGYRTGRIERVVSGHRNAGHDRCRYREPSLLRDERG